MPSIFDELLGKIIGPVKRKTLNFVPGTNVKIEKLNGAAPPPATAPAAFTAGQWTLNGTDSVGALEVDVTALPDDGGETITAIQYRLRETGGSYGAWSAFSPSLSSTGTRTIGSLDPGTEYDVQIRAVNSVGAGSDSDTKSEFPSGWAPAGYAALFETVAPSVLTPDTSFPGDVASWLDSTGVYTATAGASAPSFPGASQANGIDGVEFDGTGETLTASLSMSSSDEYAIFFVVRTTATVFHNIAEFLNSSSTPQILLQIRDDNTIRHWRGGVVVNHTSTNTLTTGAVSRIMFAYSGGNSILRVEGAAEESAALAAGSHDAGSSVIGDRAGGSGGPFDGILYALPIYGAATAGNATERQAVWDAIGTRFGI